jgi:hypothetical protein
LNADFVIPAMHGYAHNRRCQLGHHPKYKEGSGIEDFETCERFFSLSNSCAGISRYTTPFHRHQILDTHFTDSDEARRLSLGKFIFDNYTEALRRISKIIHTFDSLQLTSQLLDGTYTHHFQSEVSHLNALTLEPLEEQAWFRYVESLEKWWLACQKWETAAAKAGLSTSGVISLYGPLPPFVQVTLTGTL